MKELSCIREHQSCSLYHPCAQEGFRQLHVFTDYHYEDKDAENNRFLFLTKGSLSVSLNQHKPVTLSAGHFLLLPVSSSFTIHAGEECRLTWMTFREVKNLCRTFTLDSLKQPDAKDADAFRGLEIRRGVRTLLESVDYYLENCVYCKELHALKQKELFYLLRYNYTKEELACLFNPLLSRDKEFRTMVLENFRETRSIPELAEKCGYTLSSFNRKFKAEFQCSPYKWIQKEISNRIFYELSVNKISFSEIVFRFGFTSYSHFNRFCKKEFGMTPSDLKKELTR